TERIRGEADELRARWRNEERWRGITRPYTAEDVVRLRGRIRERHVIAENSAAALWRLVNADDYVPALGCLTGGQAVECARAGLRAIYLSGWQVAADANTAQHTYPDQSLYPVSSVPTVVRRLNNALRRADRADGADRRAQREPAHVRHRRAGPDVPRRTADRGGVLPRSRRAGRRDRPRAGVRALRGHAPVRDRHTGARRCTGVRRGRPR